MIFGVGENGSFCDWLSLTAEPESGLLDETEELIFSHLSPEVESHKGKTLYRLHSAGAPSGLITVQPEYRKVVDLITFSGSALAQIRGLDLLRCFVQAFSVYPHNLTRTDLALDQRLVNHNQVKYRLDNIRRRGHQGDLILRRKAVKPCKVKPIIRPRELDGAMTGSVMVNHRSDRYSGIVYDKRSQLFEEHGILLDHELLRFEVRTSEATLADICDPDPLFFELASPSLLPCPSNVDSWQKRDSLPMTLEPPTRLNEVQRAQRLIDSPVFDRLVDLMDSMTEAERHYVLRKADQKLRTSPAKLLSSVDKAS